MSRAWAVMLVAGIGAVVFDLAMSLFGPFPAPATPAEAIFHAAVAGAWITAGLVAWARRPALRIGMLMSAVGLTWVFSQPLWPVPLAATAAYLLFDLTLAVGLHALLAFPTGRLGKGAARAFVGSGYATVLGGNLVLLLFWAPPPGPCSACTRNLLLIDRDPALADAVDTATTLTGVAVGVIAVVLLVRRWRKASPAGRSVLGPVIWAGVIASTAVVVQDSLDGLPEVPASLLGVLRYSSWLAILLIPVAFILGLLRARLRRGALTRLMVELGGLPPPDVVGDALARALGDPSLGLVFWHPEFGTYLDVMGRQATLPADQPARTVTMLEHRGERFGALIHDPFMLEDSAMLEAVGAAGRLAIENARLQAELRAQLANVRASRARIVEASDAVRRRIERDLHDGAQQRLLAIRLALRLARGCVGRDDAELEALLAEADGELIAGLDELRSLARGIHPAVLSDEGLPAALATLARRCPIPVELRAVPAERLPPPLEAAVYFVASEALANVAKYAHASYVSMTIAHADGRLRLEVCDDGVGGARPVSGGGLSGLTDRVEALDGSLEVSSRPGAGTTLVADLPCRELSVAQRST